MDKDMIQHRDHLYMKATEDWGKGFTEVQTQVSVRIQVCCPPWVSIKLRATYQVYCESVDG
jgi:hypothetical protein